MQLIYTDSNELTEASWERLVHSLITYGENIWINEYVRFSEKIPDWKRNIYNKTIAELKEAGLIKVWSYEIEYSNFNELDNIIPFDTYSELYNAINSKIKDYGSYGTFYGKDLKGSELTSKIIQFRHELWNIGIAQILEVDGICYPSEIKQKTYEASKFYKYELINREYTNTIFKKMDIKPLGFLSALDIIELQKKGQILSEYLSKYTKNKLVEILPNKRIIDNECQLVVEDVQEQLNALINEKSLRKFGKDFTQNAIITSASMAIPVLSVVPFIEQITNRYKDNKKYSLLFFALDLKNKAFTSYNNAVNRDMNVIKYFA